MFKRMPLAFALLTACLLAAPSAVSADSKETLVRQTYLVADLVVPLPVVELNFVWTQDVTEETDKNQPSREDRLMAEIRRTVQPASWSANGGPGTIQYFPPTMSLVVNQTPTAHRRIAILLARMRQARETQVAIQVRFLSVTEEFL